MSMQARWQAFLRSSRPKVARRPWRTVEPLDVRDPDVVRALADAVAILGPDYRPRIMLGRLGAYAGLRRASTT